MGGQISLGEGAVGQLAHRSPGCFTRGVDLFADERFDDRMIERAALGNPRIGIERLDRIESQDAAGIDRVRIAPKLSRLRERVTLGDQGGIGLRFRPCGQRLPFAFIYHARAAKINLAAFPHLCGEGGPGNCGQPLQEA